MGNVSILLGTSYLAFLSQDQDLNNALLISRLTVGRVEPLLDLHRLCALDAIMIPYKVWSGRQFSVPESLVSLLLTPLLLSYAWYLGLPHNF